MEPGQSAPRAPSLSVAPNFPPLLVGPSPNPMVAALAPAVALPEVCVVSRVPDMDDLERRLQLAVVMYVGGARPQVSCVAAAEAIAGQLDIPRHHFLVHKYHPEDFLVVFSSHEFRNRALSVPVIQHAGFNLHAKPWLRQAQATSRLMRTQVDIMIEGVPSHAWSRGVATELLGKACLVESLAPEMESREDLSLFKLRAWCVDPEEIPVCRRFWVPEPPEAEGNAAARRPSFRQLLEYPTIIHVGRMRDFSEPQLWRRSGSSDGDSGQSGIPDSSNGSFAGGEWVVLPWTRGVCDSRNGGRSSAGGGSGAGRSYRQVLEGRVGPSDWRIPPMTQAGPPHDCGIQAGLQAHGQGVSNRAGRQGNRECSVGKCGGAN